MGLPVGLASYALVSSISLNTFTGLIADALKNFIVAIAWPVYWMSDISGNRIWIWFAAAYGGYWAGARLALNQVKSRNEESD